MDISRKRCTSVTTTNHYLATFYNDSESAEICQLFKHKTHLMVWSTGSDDAKMLLDIPFPMNQVITDQLAFNLVDICLDNMLQILCFAKIGKIDDYSNIAKIWLVKFCLF